MQYFAKRNRYSKLLALGAVALLAVAAAGCGGESRDREFMEGVTAAPGDAAGTTAASAATGGTTVVVILGENTLGVDTENIPAGPAVINVSNGGTEVHDLAIEGENTAVQLEGTLAAGEQQTIAVTFAPGSYTLYCPVMNHRERGEEVTIEIESP
jgi:plastocyanin